MSYPDITGHVQATGHTGGDTNWQVTDDQCDAAIWGQVAEKLKDRHDTAYYEAGPLHDHLRNSGFNRIARNPPDKHLKQNFFQDKIENSDERWNLLHASDLPRGRGGTSKIVANFVSKIRDRHFKYFCMNLYSIQD
ncbi:hypothetical protein BCR42DRAFT_397344 [Absidia repens]|uniref:Uncharacterized protein n=1 Tax=Absidia repens TaxID=90262 RepID=A0A1X2I1P8_9FUNG|nr:hypothetical protein BCR42DRAFT_397344 [Absidia repens]